MKILAVDTSANVATAALVRDGMLICESILNHKKTHSEKLMPMIDNLLKDCEEDISDIDLFAVANGPGSFTGLRIGVSTVKALAHGTNKPVVGISTLEGLAYNLYHAEGIICPIMDARRSQVYNALYKWENDRLLEIKPPRALSIEECIEDVKGCEKVYFLGDGVPVHKEKIKEKLGNKACLVPFTAALQRASSIAYAGLKRAEENKLEDYQSLMPFYLRKPQAERELEEKEGK